MAKKEIVFYQYFERTIANNGIAPIYAFSRFITLLENSASVNIRMSINDQPYQQLPQGISVELPAAEVLKSIAFYNVSGATCTIKFALSAGRIYDNRVVIAGDLDVTDISNNITTPVSTIALDENNLINNAAAVNKGGGKVGIPLTSQPFATGEILTIANTVNYNATDWIVDATSSANEVVITATYSAETFDGVDDSIGLTTPRSIGADTTRKELIIQNNGAVDVWIGDTNVDVTTKRGTKLVTADIAILSVTAAVYAMADSAGVGGAVLSANYLNKV